MAQPVTAIEDRDELIDTLAADAIRIVCGSAADARERYHGEAQQASEQLPGAVEGVLDDFLEHSDVDPADYDWRELKLDVLAVARKEVN